MQTGKFERAMLDFVQDEVNRVAVHWIQQEMTPLTPESYSLQFDD